jgi:hypothetical protein
MKWLWSILAGISLFGMVVGYQSHDGATYGINAVMFMYYLWEILYQVEN